jgi:hypothetical protein
LHRLFLPRNKNRMLNKIIITIFTLALVLIAFDSWTSGSGAGPGYTNGPNEQNCTSCHSGTLNGGSGSLSNLTISNNFTGGGYIPDSTYTLTVKYNQSSISKWGFQVMALVASNNDPAGSFTVTSNRTKKSTKSVSGKTREYVEHTSSGTSSVGTNATEWTFEWKAPGTNVGNVVFYPIVNAANGNSNNGGDQIYAKSITFGPSSLLPVARDSTTDTLICGGSTASYFGRGTNSPSSYDWVFAGGSPSVSSVQNPKITYNFPGTYKVLLRVKNSKGWSGYDTALIVVKTGPSSFISGGASRKLCKGSSLELAAQFSPTSTYLWSDGTTTGNKLTVTKPGTYYVTASSNGCSKISNEVVVSYFNDQKSTLSSDVSAGNICSGITLNFTGSTGFDTLYWYKNNQFLSKTTSNTYSTVSDSNSIYTVRVFDGNGCIGPDSDTLSYSIVARDSAPAVRCVNQTPFTVEYDWTGIKTHDGVEVSEDLGKTWASPSSGSTGNTHKRLGLNPDKPYELWVRANLGNPCNFSEVNKKVCSTGKCSPLEVTVKADTAVCDGEELTVEVNGLTGESYSISFEGGKAFNDTIFMFTPILSKKYVIQVLDSNAIGCPPIEVEFSVQLDKITDLSFRTQRASNAFCEADSIRFSAAEGNDDYNFFVNNAIRHSSADSFYYENKFTDGDSAFVIVRNGACTDTSEKIFVSVIPAPISTFTYSRNHTIFSFTPDDVDNKSYLWDFGDGFTSVVKSPTKDYAGKDNKMITVELQVEDNNACVSTALQIITMPNFTSTAPLATLGILIYPSPANDQLHLKWVNSNGEGATLSILDLNGELVLKQVSKGAGADVDVSILKAGVYVLEVKTTGGEAVRQQFMKQ